MKEPDAKVMGSHHVGPNSNGEFENGLDHIINT